MYDAPLTLRTHRTITVWLILLAGIPGAARAFDIDETRALLDRGETEQAIKLLASEILENPAHEAARMLLASAYEKAGQHADAQKTWEQVLTLSASEEHLQTARKAICRLRRIELDEADLAAESAAASREDPFKIPMPPIDWDGLSKVEETKYLPPILPPPIQFEVPPFVHETKHFTVYTTNEELSRVVGERAEIYLAFMLDRLFGGRPWALRTPILVYTTYDDYREHGGPENSGGVVLGHSSGSGSSQAVLLFQFKPESSGGGGGRGPRGGGGQEIWKYSIESVLPHELTHVVINEFFAGRKTPRWMHEAVAGRFEQTREHYAEAARLARKAVAGEFFRMRDLFEQEGYPESQERVELFYEQAAAVVLFLFEAGPVAMHAFLYELAEGHGHDAACAAALGIPEEYAVEEFERRWMDWMRRRYIKDLDEEKDGAQSGEPASLANPVFLPWANEMATIGGIGTWRDIPLDSLDAFGGAPNLSESWTVDNGVLRANVPAGQRSLLLPIRMNERAPLAVTFTVKSHASPAEPKAVIGLTQLDYAMNDLRVEAMAVLPDNNEHQITAIFGDDLAVYLDGKCTGRFAAVHHQHELAPDVDYPLAAVTYGPVEIKGLKAVQIEKFSEEPLVTATQAEPQRSTGRGRDRGAAQPQEGRKKRERRRP